MGDNILGCFMKIGFDPNLKRGEAHELGNQVSSYIWGRSGICDKLKTLKSSDYGDDLQLVLFEFHVKPTPVELGYLKEIGFYHKKDKSIGIPIIITDENFFSKSDEERYMFLKETIVHKMDLLEAVIKRRKLDTNMEKLKADVANLTFFL